MKPAVQPGNAAPPGPAGLRTQAWIGLTVLTVVSLLTLLFSFLGTISAAALVGMVFGTMRAGTGRGLLISLIFPLVSLAFAHLLTPEKNLLLAGLCFGVFWTSYGLTSVALCLERKPSMTTGAQPASETFPTYDAKLAPLQGTWRAEAASGSALPNHVLEFSRDRLSIKRSGADGLACGVFTGRVTVNRVGPYRVCMVSATGANGDPEDNRFRTAPWLFKVAGDTLTIGWDFEESTGAAGVMVYRRQTERV